MTKPNTTIKPAPSKQMTAGGRGLGVSAFTLDDVAEKYSAHDAEVLRWWFEQFKEHGWSTTDLAKKTGISTTSLSRLYRGIYEGDVAAMIQKLERARENFDAAVENPDFILTSLAKRVFAAFDKTRALRNITLLWGEMGIGKTTVMTEYAIRQDSGNTYYFRVPGYGTTLYQFTCALAEALRISPAGKSTDRVRADITRFLSRGNRLLIIDEFHEVFATATPLNIVRICEWLRELQGDDRFGLVLVGTNVLPEHFFKGRYSSVLKQLTDRGTVQIQLPAKPTKGDVVAFLKHYGLSFPEPNSEERRLLDDILLAHGLRKLTLHLRDGVAYANRIHEDFAWHHFIAAHKAIQSLNPGN